MANRMDRRSVLAALALATTGLRIPDGYASESEAVLDTTSILVDVHCHIFNASDLPVRGFVRRVVFGDEERQVVLDPDPSVSFAIGPWVIASLTEFMLRGAPTARDELSQLRGVGSASFVAAWREDSTDHVRNLADALRKILRSADPSAFVDERAFPEGGTRNGRTLFISKLQAEAGLDPAALRSDADPFAELAEGLLKGSGRVGRYFRWAKWFTAPRHRIAEQLVKLYGNGRPAALFTPSLVDFSYWLDDAPASDLMSQISVMERIQRLDLGAALHCFAPFDPWREIVDREEHREPTAFELVKWAVSEMGFIGIKLYPPMGYLPARNQGSELSYPSRARDIDSFGAKVDRALDELFAWSSQEGVAVMAHATDSNGAADGYSERARPRNWTAVLRRHPNLRLNLGHFGAFNEAKSQDGFGDSWEKDTGELIKSGTGNVFADLSYLSEILPGAKNAERLPLLEPLMRKFIEEYDPNTQFLLYGSDWLMLGQEPQHESYLDILAAYLIKLRLSETQVHGILGGNALRFLGLTQGGKTRARLDEYYRRHAIDPTALLSWDSPG